MNLFKNTYSWLSLALMGLAFCWSSQAWSQEKSASVFIRFGDLHMNYRDRNDMTNSSAVLGPGSVIQIPTSIAKFNEDGTINLNETIEYWLAFARHQQQNLGYSHFQAREWNCSALESERQADGRCRGVNDGELFFPVKVVRSSSGDIKTDGPESYGYLALDYLRTHVQPHRYETVHTTLENALNLATLSNDTTQIAGGDSNYGSETTSTQSRPAAAPVSQSQNVINCNNTRYRTPRQGFQKNSCLKKMSVSQRANLVMRDVSQINQLRSSFNLDPRFSACIAYRESHMHPNAKGGTPDWGMYQVIDSTGRAVLRRNNPVTPGFSQYRYNWVQYRDNMLRSTLAQSDLHHSVLFEKARENNLIRQVNSKTTRVSVYQKLATRYNGDGARARHYGSKIANCYKAMLKVAKRDGTVTNSAALEGALKKALN